MTIIQLCLAALMFGTFRVNGLNLNLSKLQRCRADLTIAGLFPMLSAKPYAEHKWDSNGVQEALAMIYTVYNINNNKHLLPNVTLGVDVLDTQDQSDHAIQSCLQFDFVQRYAAQNQQKYNSSTVAVIGLRKSSVARSIATLTQLFGVPTISYGSTDHTLSDNQKFPYFASTIPNNQQLVRAVLALLKEMHWDIFFVIYDDQSDYGRSAFQIFQDEYVKKHQETICITWSVSITYNNIEETMATMKTNILPKFPYVKTMVVFAHQRTASSIIIHAISQNFSDFTWILTSGFDIKTKGFQRTLETWDLNNAIILFYPKWNESYFVDGYESFVIKHLESSQLHALAPDLTNCHQHKCLYVEGIEGPFFSHLLGYVTDAVYVVAHALHKMLKCDQGKCDLSYPKSNLWNYIMNISFTSVSNYTLKFNKNGDVLGQYQLALIKQTNQSKKSFDKIMHRNMGNINILYKARIWNGATNRYEDLKDEIRNLPKFSCFQTCQPGEERSKSEVCEERCNTCHKCSKGKYSNTTNTNACSVCPKFFTPNENQDNCIAVKVTFVKYDSILGITLLTLTGVGHFVVLVTGVVFVKYRDTHIIKASSCEVSLLMLIGAFCCFTSTFLTLSKINGLKCQLTIIMSGISLSLMIGALLVKTNRVYRIFDKNILRKGLPKMLSIFWQRAIILGIIFVDVALSLAIAYYPTDNARHELKISDAHKAVYSMCYYNTKLVSAWWVFNCSLVLLCTYQAILARKVPGNYKEARNIMLSMLAITLEIIILLPSFYYESSGFHRQLVLTFINIVSATSTICFMFLPKMYVIFFRPWENCEELPHGHMGFFLQESITSTNTLDSSSSGSIAGSRNSDGRKRHNNCCRKIKRKLKKEGKKLTTHLENT